MSARFKMGKVYPDFYKVMGELDALIESSGVDKWHRELIRIRASQINGCAYCLHKHTEDALKLGTDPRKINLILLWEEAKDVFTDEEQLLLEMTEQVTLINKGGISKGVYQKAIQTYGEEKTAQLMMIMITINAWNRIGVGLRLQPELEAR